MRTFALLIALSCLGAAQTSSLNAQRAHTLRAVGHYFETHLQAIQRCGVDARDSESTGGTFTFPAGRADRFYQLSYGQGFAFQVKSGQARLVWCGVYLDQPGNVASKLPGNLISAFRTPMRTLSGVLPVERGGMDVWKAFNYTLTVTKLDVQGRRTCQKSYSMPNYTLTLPSPDNLRYGCP